MTVAAFPRMGKWFARTLISMGLACAVSFHPSAHAADANFTKAKLNKRGLDIKVAETGWGDACPDDIEEVLYAVAAELVKFFPDRPLPSIKVEHGEDIPVALFERAPTGEYVIHLSAKDRRWSQFAYQFAHELTHVLSNFDNSQSRLANASDPNQWFEESVCEAASLFALKQLAATWEVAPPYPQWKNYAPALRRYADQMTTQAHRTLPPGQTLAGWFTQNENSVRENPYLRNKNEIVAGQLLKLLERNPEQWAAVGYLNHDKLAAPKTIDEYMQRWLDSCPDAHKAFVQEVMNELGMLENGKPIRLASAQN
jgi:hypothetical protein